MERLLSAPPVVQVRPQVGKNVTVQMEIVDSWSQWDVFPRKFARQLCQLKCPDDEALLTLKSQLDKDVGRVLCQWMDKVEELGRLPTHSGFTAAKKRGVRYCSPPKCAQAA